MLLSTKSLSLHLRQVHSCCQCCPFLNLTVSHAPQPIYEVLSKATIQPTSSFFQCSLPPSLCHQHHLDLWLFMFVLHSRACCNFFYLVICNLRSIRPPVLASFDEIRFNLSQRTVRSRLLWKHNSTTIYYLVFAFRLINVFHVVKSVNKVGWFSWSLEMFSVSFSYFSISGIEAKVVV